MTAVAREWLLLPPAPAIAQPHPSKLCHQVQLRGPRVPERNGEALEFPADDFKVMGCKALRRHVVFVEAPSVLDHAEGADILPGHESLEVWNGGLDNEAAPGSRCAATFRKHAT